MSYGQYSPEHVEERRNPLRAKEEIQPKRQRNVFPTDEIPHLWMHKSQASARNAAGNLFFRDETIFSYGEHFPIARHVTNGKEGKRERTAVLFTTGKYSVTTARHISAVRGAIPKSVEVFEVPDLGSDYKGWHNQVNHEANLTHYQKIVGEHIRTAARARSSHVIEWNRRTAGGQREECKAYCKFFRLRVPKLEMVPAMDAAELADIRRKERERAAKQAKEEKAEKAAAYMRQIKGWMDEHPDYATRWDGTVENAEALARAFRDLDDARRVEAWLAGNGNSLPRGTETMLRVVGEEVQTSMGAKFPVSHARKGLALVEAVRARGEEWKRNGHSCRLGVYQIEKIDKDGTVYAGCHVVRWEAIERIREQLAAAAADLAADLADSDSV